MALLKFNILNNPLLQAPLVDAGIDQILNANQTLTILQGNITDDGFIVSIQWTQVSGNSVIINTSNNLQTQISNLQPNNSYRFRLTAIDNDGLSSFDEVDIIVDAQIQIQVSNSIINLNYNSTSNNINDTLYNFNLSNFNNNYSNSNNYPIQFIKIISLSNRGEIGLNTNLVTINQLINIIDINNNNLKFFADLINMNSVGGNYQTSFTFKVIDTQGNQSNTATCTINASDIGNTNPTGLIRWNDTNTIEDRLANTSTGSYSIDIEAYFTDLQNDIINIKIEKSTNQGSTWSTFIPSLNGNNFIDSIANIGSNWYKAIVLDSIGNVYTSNILKYFYGEVPQPSYVPNLNCFGIGFDFSFSAIPNAIDYKIEFYDNNNVAVGYHLMSSGGGNPNLWTICGISSLAVKYKITTIYSNVEITSNYINL